MPLHSCRYGYKDDTLCSECGGDMVLAFAPLGAILVVALLAGLSFLKGGSLLSIDMRTFIDGGAKAAIEEAVQAKHDEML